MRIGIYIGSFNPPHLGHKKVIDFLLEKDYVDKVVIVPTKNYWNKTNLIDIEDRINMLKYYENTNIEIDTIHNNYPYTYELLNKLKEVYPTDELYLIIGSDNLDELHEWKNIDDLLNNKIIVLKRGTIKKNPNIDDKNIMKENLAFLFFMLQNYYIKKKFNNIMLGKKIKRMRFLRKDKRV